MTPKMLPKLVNERQLFRNVQGSSLLETIFEDDVHAKRLESLRNAALGAFHSGNLAIHAIGTGYSALNRSMPKHGIKQVDRLLSNQKLVVWDLFKPWTKFLVSGRKELVVALDWTDFDDDDHTTLAAYLVSTHGRSSPLVWLTVMKSELKDNRNDLEFKVIDHLHALLPTDLDIILLADRGFGDQKLYAHLEFLGWDYVIRFRENISVENDKGEQRPASEWVAKNGRTTKLLDAKVTQDRAQVPCVVTVKAARMKDAWCLASSLKDRDAKAIVALYGRRFTIEETFRDTKDIHFGMGLSATHIKDAGRRDRLMMIAAIAQVLMTLLGAASEKAGLDRMLKANTAKKRTHSLYRQGLYWYGVLDSTREDWRERLMAAYEVVLAEHAELAAIYGVI